MGFFKKIFNALKKTKDSLASKISSLFSSNKIGEEFYEELEEILISSDISLSTSMVPIGISRMRSRSPRQLASSSIVAPNMKLFLIVCSCNVLPVVVSSLRQRNST